MSEKFKIGQIVEGKIMDIKPFGAFVQLDETTQGLVHISQVAHNYVKDIATHLTVGEVVKVKVLSIDENTNKISLSIKETLEAPERTERPARKPAGNFNNRPPKHQEPPKVMELNFEDKIKDWLKQSNERHTELNKRNKK